MEPLNMSYLSRLISSPLDSGPMARCAWFGCFAGTFPGSPIISKGNSRVDPTKEVLTRATTQVGVWTIVSKGTAPMFAVFSACK